MSAGQSGEEGKVSRDLALLAPAFRKAVEDAIRECNAPPNNLGAMVYEAYRSQTLQAIYYARGRTTVPPTRTVTNARTNLLSWHGYGLAVDVIHQTKLWSPDGGMAWFRKVADIFKKHGCKWGGDWTSPDPPHMQWGRCRPSPSDEARRLIAADGIEAVWRAVSASADDLERAAVAPAPSPASEPTPIAVPTPAPATPPAPPSPTLVDQLRSAVPPVSADPPVLAWGRHVSEAFRTKLIDLCGTLGADPSDMMSCMAFESGETFRPDIRNAAGSGAVGLIQFMPATAIALGTTVEQLAGMTAEDQLDYVARYFRPQRGRLKNLGDVYMAILWPQAVGKPDSFVLFDRNDPTHPKRYTQNAGLDISRDGLVTRQEALSKVNAKLTKGLLQDNHWLLD